MRAGVLIILLGVLAPRFLLAQTTREDALARVFPGADIEAERLFLTEAQRLAAVELSGVDVSSLLLARYVATRDGQPAGRAYVYTHVVRTKNESLLICLNPDGTVRRIEVTAFLEPPEYLASEPWYAQFEGRALDDELNLNRAIRPIAGATLTARSTADAVRRVLGIDAVLSRTVEVDP